MSLANGVDYGLTAGIYGTEEEVGWFFDRIEAGVAYANGRREQPPAPGRGISSSGAGRGPVPQGRTPEATTICSFTCMSRFRRWSADGRVVIQGSLLVNGKDESAERTIERESLPINPSFLQWNKRPKFSFAWERARFSK